MISDYSPLYDSTLIEQAIQKFYTDANGPVANGGGSYACPAGDDDPLREQWTPGDGATAFYTANQSLVFQQCRPRVWIDDFAFSEMPEAQAMDTTGVLRCTAWTGRIRLGLITEPNFKLHRDLRNQNLAIIPMMQATIKPDATGIDYTQGLNQYLTVHEIGRLSVANVTPGITPQQGYYLSPITINLTWSLRVTPLLIQ